MNKKTPERSTLYELLPNTEVCFQWKPWDTALDFPVWFQDLMDKFQAYQYQVDDHKFLKIPNKRGDQIAYPGDWICKDRWGHYKVISQSTFPLRFKQNSHDLGDNT